MAFTAEASNNQTSNQSSSAVNEDSVNPFFLGSSDSNTVQLVTEKLIGGKNYFPWARSMIISLTTKNKIGFIIGTIPIPDSDSPQFILWTQCNMTVLSWIVNSISPGIGSSIMYTDNVRAIWLDLLPRFSQKNGPRIFELQKESPYLVQGQASMEEYFTKFKALVDELANYLTIPHCKCPCTCGAQRIAADLGDRDQVMRFLMGLDVSYSAIRGPIFLYQLLPDINKAASPQVAAVNTVGPSSSQPLALSASSHSVDYLNNFAGKAFCSSSFLLPNSTIFTARVVNRSSFTATDWIIDTGAIDHMVHSIAMFSSITCVSNTYVYLPNAERALVTHVETIHLSENLILIDVLCVPSFTFNLTYFSHLNRSLTCCLIFIGSFCFIQYLALWSTIGLGREQNGLYLLDNKFKILPTVPATSSFGQSVCTQPNLWHFCLGHPSSGKLDLLNKDVPFVQSNKTSHYAFVRWLNRKDCPLLQALMFLNFLLHLFTVIYGVLFQFPQCMVIDFSLQ
ncbi:uncharacterized protein LOC142624881 [Castanea sativa]|uniref:uncharacterized protein LOC142624881 n=1 Tax=Castanea sativa TaxID=21020 RepID=UPI003F64D825